MPTPTGSSSAATVPLTGVRIVDSLLSGRRWDGPVTYSFAETATNFSTASFGGYGGNTGDGEPWTGFQALSAPQREAFSQALAAWMAVANIRVTEVAETATLVGDIRAAFSGRVTGNTAGWAYEPATSPLGGDIWLNERLLSGSGWSPGTDEYGTLLHEIGHALGLKHPFEEGTTLPSSQDTQVNTVMSYSSLPGIAASSMNFYPTTPMVYDIAAIQAIYGPNMAWHAGADAYVYDDSRFYMETLWDGGGSDTLRYDGAGAAVIDLSAGAGSTLGRQITARSPATTQPVANVWIAQGAVIENATGGSAADTITGNAADNVLEGRGGNDRIDGGAGTDVAVFSGSSAQYSIAFDSAASVYNVTDSQTGRDGVDRLTNVERVRFSDGERAISSAAAQPALAQAEALSVLGTWRGFFGSAPGSADYGAAAGAVRSGTVSSWAIGLGSGFGGANADSLASQVLGNFGMGASTLGGATPLLSYEALREAVGIIFTVFAPARGQVVLNVANLLRGLESDAVFGGVARNFNSRVNSDFLALQLVGVDAPDGLLA